MDKLAQKEFAEELTAKIFQKITPGSAFWRLNEVFSLHLSNDSGGVFFNEDFANGLAKSRGNFQSLQKRWMLVQYLALVLLVSSVTGYVLPVDFPYVNAGTSIGIVEIALIVLLLSHVKLADYGMRINFLGMLLRTYANFRYSKEETAQDFYLLRWGVDDVVKKMHSKKYLNYVQVGFQGKLKKVISLSYGMSAVIFIVAETILIVFGILYVFLHPSFGWMSYLVMAGVLFYWLENLINCLSVHWHDLYRKEEPR